MILRVFVHKFAYIQEGVIHRLCVNSLQISVLFCVGNECLLQDPTFVYAWSGYDSLYSCSGSHGLGRRGQECCLYFRSLVKTSFVCIFLHSKRSFSTYYFTIFIHLLCTVCVVSLGLYIPTHINFCIGPRNI